MTGCNTTGAGACQAPRDNCGGGRRREPQVRTTSATNQTQTLDLVEYKNYTLTAGHASLILILSNCTKVGRRGTVVVRNVREATDDDAAPVVEVRIANDRVLLAGAGPPTMPIAIQFKEYLVLEYYVIEASLPLIQVFPCALAPPVITGYTSPVSYSIDQVIEENGPPTATGAITEYKADNLPAGLVIDPSTGTITGTPTAVAEAATVTVTAVHPHGDATATITVTIQDKPITILSAPGAASWTIGAAAPTTLGPPSMSGGTPTSWEIFPDTLPDGLTFTDGVISGTATTDATHGALNFMVKAVNGTGTATWQVIVTVHDAAPSFGTDTYSADLAALVCGMSVSYCAPENVGGAISHFSITPPLPAGLTLNTRNGTITGRPTAYTAVQGYAVTAHNEYSHYSATTVVQVGVTRFRYRDLKATFDYGKDMTAIRPVLADGSSFAKVTGPAFVDVDPTTGTLTGTASSFDIQPQMTVSAIANGVAVTSTPIDLQVRRILYESTADGPNGEAQWVPPATFVAAFPAAVYDSEGLRGNYVVLADGTVQLPAGSTALRHITVRVQLPSESQTAVLSAVSDGEMEVAAPITAIAGSYVTQGTAVAKVMRNVFGETRLPVTMVAGTFESAADTAPTTTDIIVTRTFIGVVPFA